MPNFVTKYAVKIRLKDICLKDFHHVCYSKLSEVYCGCNLTAGNRPVSQIPHCIRQLSHNAPFCLSQVERRPSVPCLYSTVEDIKLSTIVSPTYSPKERTDVIVDAIHWQCPMTWQMRFVYESVIFFNHCPMSSVPVGMNGWSASNHIGYFTYYDNGADSTSENEIGPVPPCHCLKHTMSLYLCPWPVRPGVS